MWNRRILNINNWTCEHLAARNQHITQDDVAKAKRIVSKNIIHVSILEEAVGLFIEALVCGQQGKSRVVIKDKHDNIVLVEKNGEVVFKKEETKLHENSLTEEIKKLTIKDLKDFVDKVGLKQLDLVVEGIRMNKYVRKNS